MYYSSIYFGGFDYFYYLCSMIINITNTRFCTAFIAEMKRTVFLIILLLGCYSLRAQVVINELMQSNVDCIMDDLDDFPDSWVELYNTGDKAIDLSEWRLGISGNVEEAWQLDDTMIPPKQYALVYCDKVGEYMHTPFRLESGKGCEVWLFKGTEVADTVRGLRKQPSPNVSYGRKTDGGDEWGYMLKPTPNEINRGGICDYDHILGEPVFSEKGFVMNGTKQFKLELSLPEGSPEGTEIRYTTDGKEPTVDSKKYTSGITINKSMAVRAKLFCEGWLSPRSSVESYIFHDRNVTIPIISIVTDDDYLNDEDIGIFVNNKTHEKDDQVNWRRPINIELFDTENEPAKLNQLCETRITGAWSREASRQSMAIYCHKRFGKKNMEYEFFPDQCPGLTDYKSVVLRNAGNDRDGLYMRDAICQRTMAENADIDWQAWRPAVVYINGNYWCMLNIRERANENNIITHYDGMEDIDLIENEELKEGTDDNYWAFKKFVNEKGHTLAEYAELMDWEEYLRITIMNMYFNNLDYPGNNNVLWRPRGEGGKWRWIAKDLDYTMGLYGSNPGSSGAADHKIIAQWYNPNDWNLHQGANFSITTYSTQFFRNLMENEDFAREFIDRFCIYMGDFLNEQGIRKVWDPMYEMIKDEWKRHKDVVYDNPWWPNYDSELNAVRSWVSTRTAEMYKQLSSQYTLGYPITMTINKKTSEAGSLDVMFNGVRLTNGTFDGKFFPYRDVTLEGRAPEGYEVKGWEMVIRSSSGSENRQIDGERCSFKMPSCSSIAINAILGEASAISSVREQAWTWQRYGDEITFSGVPAGTKVQVYDLRGILLRSVVSDGSDIVLPCPQGRLHVMKVGNKVLKL